MSAQPIDQWPSRPVPFTEAILEGLPHNGYTYEISDGTLLVTPPASDTHMDLAAAILVWLTGDLDPEWIVRMESGIGVDGSSYVPDLVVLRPETPRNTGELFTSGEFAELVVEIASKHTRDYDRTMKLRRYARQGIPMYWQVDHDAAGLTINIHSAPSSAGYERTASVTVGETHSITEPFALTIDPGRLATRIGLR